MPAIYMPPAIEPPAVIESIGMMEIFADGGIIRYGPVLSETILYRLYGGHRH